MDFVEFEADIFKPPAIVEFLKRPLDFPRGQYSTSFADLLSKETVVQDTYKDGLVALSCFLGGIMLVWGLILVFLMIKGRSVGCASGRAFETLEGATRGANKPGPPISSTDSEEDETHSINDDDDDGEHDDDEHDVGEHDVGVDMEESSFPSSLCSSDVISRFESDTHSLIMEEHSVDACPRVEGWRAARTRVVFFLFACTVLACVPLALAFSFAPMKETVKTFDGSFDETDDVIAQTRAALSTISTASQSAMGILSQTSTNFSTFCPNVNQTKTVLGVDLLGLANLISSDYVSLQTEVTDDMTKIENMLQAVEEAVEIMESSFKQAENVIWLVPGLLLGVSIVTALATFGVILAWKQESGLRLQRFMSYGVLPALVAICILCWILAIASTVSTAVSTDFCLSGPNLGSPDTTIQNMLIIHGDSPNTTKYQFLTAYTTGCEGRDPTLLLVQLEEESQNKVDDIWQYIAEIDQVGRSVLSEECGGSGLDELLSAARNIAKLLTKVRRALDSMSDGLMCERINPLYSDTVHGSICTDFAEASAWGTILFVVLGVSIMILITLRASWRLRVDEDKIYHDESEVAENMIVNEHEEYLRYISRYKHEWQEYDGFGSASMRKSASYSGSEEDPEEFSFHSGSGSASQTTGYSHSRDERGLHDGLTSIESGDISFPSLEVPPSEDSSVHIGAVVSVPPSIITDTREQSLQPTHNQKVMLFQQAMPPPSPPPPPPPGKKQKPVTRMLLHAAPDGEEEMVEVEPTRPEAIEKLSSSDTDVSTDFSSIGRNAGRTPAMNPDMSPGLYWKHQIGLGIEVALSGNEDSLDLSPNSESGLDSFDLTKTPSPKKHKASFGDLSDKVILPPSVFPGGLYTKESSDENENDTVNGIGRITTRVRTEPYAFRPSHSHRSVASAVVGTVDAKEDRRESLLSLGAGSVQFQEDGSVASPSQVQKQVTHFSKTGSKIGSLPKTPTRTKKRLSGLAHVFGAKPTT